MPALNAAAAPWCARLILAADIGVCLAAEQVDLPTHLRIITGRDAASMHLAAPLERIPIAALTGARYVGEPLGVLAGPTWAAVDAFLPLLQLDVPDQREDSITGVWETRISGREELPATEQPETVEGSYATEAQLHICLQPMRVRAEPTATGLTIEVPTHWPTHTLRSVAAVTGLPVKAIQIQAFPDPAYRDAAIVFPAVLACWSALAARGIGAPVILALRYANEFLYGGRPSTKVRIESAADRNEVIEVAVRCGAYPALGNELAARCADELLEVYQTQCAALRLRVERSAGPPAIFFEGLLSAQLSFARELHATRVAELAEQDPLQWRIAQLPKHATMSAEVCLAVGEAADFSRRFAAAEIVRKRRGAINWDEYPLRGFGVALGQQSAGLMATPIESALLVQLDFDGGATIVCTLPAPNPRLATLWRETAADALGLEVNRVRLVTNRYDELDGGPAIMGRGITLVPAAIRGACQALGRQRFRKPLPLRARRPIRDALPARGGAHRAVAACAAEVTVDPVGFTIAVRAITIAVFAGVIADRTAAEFELRRGIYQALAWTLGESVPDAQPIAALARSGQYQSGFRGAQARIKIVFLNGGKSDPHLSIGELAFAVVPAAVVAAVSQATGLYLDSIPIRAATVLQYLEGQ